MNRPYLPPFFTLYDLPADSDERTLKRTYARELKKIDQATELEAFQALRDSYEQALEWLRNGASDVQMFVQDAVVTPLSDDQPVATITAPAAIGTFGYEAAPSNDSDTPSFDAFRRANGIPVTPGNTAFTQRDPEVLARLAFEVVIAAVTSTQASEQTIDAALCVQMENPDMLNMDARFLFETAIARYLLDGWAPGKDWLFQSAVRHFDWLAHQERARQASDQAFVLLNAIGEWNQFEFGEDGMTAQGRLYLNTVGGSDVYTVMKESPNMFGGVSVGAYADEYQWVKEDGSPMTVGSDDPYTDGYFQITKGGLREVSVVMYPNNPNAEIQTLEDFDAQGNANPRVIEKLLREAGVSRKDATTASSILKKLLALRDVKPEAKQEAPIARDADAVDQEAQLLRAFELRELEKALSKRI